MKCKISGDYEKALTEARRQVIPQTPDLEDKVPYELLDFDFLAAMCWNWKTGLKNGRKMNEWKKMKWTKQLRDLYIAKVIRHLVAFSTADTTTAREHLAAIACNVNILWHHERTD